MSALMHLTVTGFPLFYRRMGGVGVGLGLSPAKLATPSTSSEARGKAPRRLEVALLWKKRPSHGLNQNYVSTSLKIQQAEDLQVNTITIVSPFYTRNDKLVIQ